MAFYDTSKQITKFTISGVIAVLFDFSVYYSLSNLFDVSASTDASFIFGLGWTDVFKGLGFIAGTFVTYNLNKFWTWRQKDKNNKRLRNFFFLYFISFCVNILINRYAMGALPNHDFVAEIRHAAGTDWEIIALKVDKLAAFLIATLASSILTFIGQKTWIFKVK